MLGFLSPVSVFAGCVAAVIAIAALWPLNGFGSAVALFAFAIGGGVTELVRRLASRPKAIVSSKVTSNAVSKAKSE